MAAPQLIREISMKTKYFRFLYHGDKGCFIHAGELEDTATQERFIFIYLSGTKQLADQEDTDNSLFLCPETVDLVVAGDDSQAVTAALERLTETAQVKLLIVPEEEMVEKLSKKHHVERVLCLSADKTSGKSGGGTDTLRLSQAGWKFFIKSYEAGRLVMAHGPEEARPGKRYEDCVMCVHGLNRKEWEAEVSETDGYVWAAGRTLYEDYDVCRYQKRKDGDCYLAGSLLLGNINAEKYFGGICDDLGDFLKEIRFFLLPGLGREEDWTDEILETGNVKNKRYFIGMEQVMEEKVAARIALGNFYQIPVSVGEEQGIRCAGFLKYRE